MSKKLSFKLSAVDPETSLTIAKLLELVLRPYPVIITRVAINNTTVENGVKKAAELTIEVTSVTENNGPLDVDVDKL